jgi:hypothetical protein
MPDILPSGGQSVTQCFSRAATGLTDQDDRFSMRDPGRIERRQWMIQGTGNVTAPKFMRLSDIDENTFILAEGLHQLVMFDGRDAG